MKLIRALAPTLLAPLFVLTAATAQAADASDAATRGEDLAWQYRCMTCHGVTGISTDERYPYLAGQKAAYLVDRLKYFKSEQEPFNQMNGQARQLSDEDMQDLAAYFSAQRR